jgi:hypothetical protein
MVGFPPDWLVLLVMIGFLLVLIEFVHSAICYLVPTGQLALVGSSGGLELRKVRNALRLPLLRSRHVVFDRGRAEVSIGARRVCRMNAIVAVGVEREDSRNSEVEDKNFIYLVFRDERGGEQTLTLDRGGSINHYRMIQESLCAYMQVERR